VTELWRGKIVITLLDVKDGRALVLWEGKIYPLEPGDNLNLDIEYKLETK